VVEKMSNSLIVFGVRQIAEVPAWYIERERDYRVTAFTVEGAFLTHLKFQGRPVVPFKETVRRYPPRTHEMFVPLSYAKMNRVRTEKFAAAKAAGYQMTSHVSTRAQVWDGLRLGENSFVMEHNVVQPFARIGANSILWAGNHIGHHATIGDHCFIASHIVISGSVRIEDYCFIGVNATLRDGITVATRSLIGAGALILGDTQPEQVFMAEPTPASRVPSSRVRI
jgi:sugar O-acyltransferase (sialic acid O-acetyltransferase NeuD family)